jgi:hypothetical protein
MRSVWLMLLLATCLCLVESGCAGRRQECRCRPCPCCSKCAATATQPVQSVESHRTAEVPRLFFDDDAPPAHPYPDFSAKHLPAPTKSRTTENCWFAADFSRHNVR